MITANFLNSSEVTTDRLFQWDIGQQLKIENIGSATTPNVHFCNKKSDNALVVEIKDGVYNIPNTLLAEEYDITAFIYVGDETEAKTIKVIHIPVTKRTKPSSYIYTTDKDVIDFMAVSAEIHSLLDGLVITPYDNTKTYKKPNMVYYMGQSYICKSDTEITGILPTDDTKWGLMCKNGANVSEITFSNDTLTFTLDSGDLIGVPLNTSPLELYKDTIDNIIGLNLSQDENGVLKLGDVIIPQKKIIESNLNATTTPRTIPISIINLTLPNVILEENKHYVLKGKWETSYFVTMINYDLFTYAKVDGKLIFSSSEMCVYSLVNTDTEADFHYVRANINKIENGNTELAFKSMRNTDNLDSFAIDNTITITDIYEIIE